ncbi:MAG: lytic transglycosylase domain-containing protein [Bacteroidales bacterium]|nr:lytic transglycosylase domain-containing protein [Bacteroidales bacterium]
MKKITSTILITFSIIGIISLFIFAKDYLKSDKPYNDLRDSTYSVYALPVPDSVTFAGELVPLENFDVREALDKELHKITYWHSETFLYFKKAHRYFPAIEKVLAENNIPDDFKYLAIAESGLSDVVSPAKATGFWQFMKKTAISYGLEVNNEIDERYNILKSTKAACRFLKDARRKYKDWALVAASYNMGQGNLDKQIQKQDSKSYYDLLLNSETSRYVYRIIAFKLILSNPQDYGFKFRKKDLYPQISTYEVKLDSTVTDFAAYAKHFNTNYKMLKYFNPWLRDSFLTNKYKKTYTIILPEKNARNKNYFINIQDSDIIINSINY